MSASKVSCKSFLVCRDRNDRPFNHVPFKEVHNRVAHVSEVKNGVAIRGGGFCIVCMDDSSPNGKETNRRCLQFFTGDEAKDEFGFGCLTMKPCGGTDDAVFFVYFKAKIAFCISGRGNRKVISTMSKENSGVASVVFK